MNVKNKIVLISLVLIIGVSFFGTGQTDPRINNLKERNKAFIKLSQEQDLLKAYVQFLHKDGIVLPDDGHPIVGLRQFKWQAAGLKRAVKKILLAWHIEKVVISQSGDLGYTLGKYSLKYPESEMENRNGYFASLWKKGLQDEWKLVFTQGLFPFKIFNRSPKLKITIDQDKNKRKIIAAELAFAQYALDHGIPQAFYNFISNNGIALTSSGLIQNKDTFLKLISLNQQKKSNSLLEWKPIFSFVSSSGDLGYNTGPYKYTTYHPTEGKKEYKGYFFTIWNKEGGQWKFIYDGGNQLSED